MKRKTFWITLAAVLAVIGAMIWAEVRMDSAKTWDTEHPFVNTQVSWAQTWHAGAWGDAL